MNSLIVFPDECTAPERIVLRGQRAQALFGEYKSREGQEIKIAVFGAGKGVARLCTITSEEIGIEILQMEPSIPLLPIDLVVGLSRPQTIKKVIQGAVMTGARSLHLVSTELGEKSYSTATLLSPENLQAEVMKALEQIGEGLAPVIHVHRSFRYFCRTHLDGLGQGGEPVKLLAHPQATELMPGNAFDRKKSLVVAIGPESGWSPGELTHFEERGFHRIGLGPRVMRVEIALVFLLGQIRILGVE